MSLRICEEHCGKDAVCEYEVCPFEHKYTYEGEVVSGYKCVTDPIKDRMLNWAKDFKENHDCNTCPFIIDEVDIGVGIQIHCDCVCKMDIPEILEEMEGACVDCE